MTCTLPSISTENFKGISMKHIFYFSLAALLFTGCNPNTYEDALNEAPKLEGNLLAGQTAYQTYNCASCHGEDASTSALGMSRIISQIDTIRDIENSLLALQYPLSARSSIMKDIASKLNDQEVIDLSTYIISLKQTN